MPVHNFQIKAAARSLVSHVVLLMLLRDHIGPEDLFIVVAWQKVVCMST